MSLDKKQFAPLLENFHSKPCLKDGKLMPYVLFGHILKNNTPKGIVEEPSLHLLDCSGSTGQAAIIRHYTRTKGYIILDHFLPPLDGQAEQRSIPRGAHGVHLWSGRGDGRDPFSECREEVELQLKPIAEIERLEAENAELRKIAALSADKVNSGQLSIDERAELAQAAQKAEEEKREAQIEKEALAKENAELKKQLAESLEDSNNTAAKGKGKAN